MPIAIAISFLGFFFSVSCMDSSFADSYNENLSEMPDRGRRWTWHITCNEEAGLVGPGGALEPSDGFEKQLVLS